MKTNTSRAKISCSKTITGRLSTACANGLLPLLLLCTLPATVQAGDYWYTTNDGTITIKGYTGPGGVVTIPSLITGLPVTTIGSYAFYNKANLISVTIPSSVTTLQSGAFNHCTSLATVTIPASVTSIEQEAFGYCTSLAGLTVDGANPSFSSRGGVLFDKTQTVLVVYPAGKAGTYTVPDGVANILWFAFLGCAKLTQVTLPNDMTSIGYAAFFGCNSLTSLTIPDSVTSLGMSAFESCIGLRGVYFQGNAPSTDPSAFYSDTNTVYYLPGTAGWTSTFAGRPTALWELPNPLILNNGPSFGVQTNGFGFIISWATNIPVVVEACTDPGNPTWVPVGTNTLTSGLSFFSDPQWTDYASRFYRLRSQ